MDYWYHHDPYHHKDIDEPLINTPHGYLIYEDVFYAIFYYPFFIIFMSLTFIILSLKFKITQIIAETTVFCSIKALLASYCGPRRHFSS